MEDFIKSGMTYYTSLCTAGVFYFLIRRLLRKEMFIMTIFNTL